MGILKILFTLLVFCNLSFAQDRDELEKEKLRLEGILNQQRSITDRERETIKQEQKNLKEKDDRLKALNAYEANFAKSKAAAITELSERIKKLPLLKKIGHKAGFFKCLRSSLEDRGFMTYDQCLADHKNKLSDDELASLNAMKAATGIVPENLKKERDAINSDVKRSEANLKRAEESFKASQGHEEVVKTSIKSVVTKKAEYDLLPKYKNVSNCDANTPEVNLEEKLPFPGATFQGAFFEVPRDNQDGIGSCFANTAKNLLVGISGGKDVASFLDLALAYKNTSGGLANSGLDGGFSCTTLENAKKLGYCPQKFAPLETGERNQAGESLFNLEPHAYMGTSIGLVKSFINGLDSIQKGSGPLKDTVLSKSHSLLTTLKNNPDIIIPLPIVRYDIPEKWKLRETYALKKAQIGIPEEQYLSEYNAQYKLFYPKYVKAVIDGKNQEQIFSLYKNQMLEFLKKYGLESQMAEYKRVFLLSTNDDFHDPQLKKKMRASLDFLKMAMNKTEDSDSSFSEYCANNADDSLQFLGSLQPFLNQLKIDKVNEDLLYNKDGKFKSAQDLMQLTVAPSCLNPKNRKPLPPFTCDDGYATINNIKASKKSFDEQVKALRDRVVISLMQGYPLGNSFSPNGNAGHINTIVGMRFNTTLNRCEYRIRESQTGTSDWHAESKIFEKIQALTEVRRVK